MNIDSIYQTVQALLNKEQLGYLGPLHFNLFLKKAQRKLYDQYFTDLKSNVRKSNWFLDGKDFANYSEHIRQYLEYFSFEANISPENPGTYVFPEDLEFVEDVFNGDKRIEKIHYSDLLDLQRNIYAKPNECSSACSKVGDKLKVSPNTIDVINVHYLRKPKTPKWTFEDVDGKPMFDPDKNDFQDVDMPEGAYDDLISLVFESGSIHLREFNATQAANQEQSQDSNLENRQ